MGELGDYATDGFWELGDPNPTYDDYNNIVQTDLDHTENGELCYFTANGNNPNKAVPKKERNKKEEDNKDDRGISIHYRL